MAEAATLIGTLEPRIVTIDNGGTQTRIAVTEGGALERIEAYPTPPNFADAVAKLALHASNLLGGKKPDAVGVSLAAAVERGRIMQAGKLAEYGWLGRNFAQSVGDAMDVSIEYVSVENDCKAGANAERHARNLPEGKAGAFKVLSTGYGGALYVGDMLIADEPGHRKLKPGARCGCGSEGCNEAHFAGSGIERKFGVRAENIAHDDPRWREIKDDFHNGVHGSLMHYGEVLDLSVEIAAFTGSVALGGPNMLPDLQAELTYRMGKYAPVIEEAVYGDKSGLYGAMFAAQALVR